MTIIKGGLPPGALTLPPGGLFERLPQNAAAPTTSNTTLNTRPSQLPLPKLLQVVLHTNSGLSDAAKKLLAAGIDDTLKAVIESSATTDHLISSLNSVATVLRPKRLPATA